MICRSCGHVNREGELMCSACGDFLPVEMDSRFRLRRGAAHRSFLILFEFGGDIHRVKVREGRQLVIGRDMETSNDQALAELAARMAREGGVSRQHAALYVRDGSLLLADLNSTNGTYLNGQRMIPEEPYSLKSNDVVSFGALEAHLYLAAHRTDSLDV